VKRSRLIALLVVTSSLLASSTLADPPRPREPTRLLRQLTLDLVGRPPTEAEYARTIASGGVEDEVIDRLLESDEHRAVLRGYHRLLLQDTLVQLPQLAANPWVLAPAGGHGTDDAPWFSPAGAVMRRGAARVSCANVRHDRFAEDGSALPLVEAWAAGDVIANAAEETTRQVFVGDGACSRERPCRIDGWVETSPYWAPETTIRVCAFEAQTTARGVDTRGRPQACDPRDTTEGPQGRPPLPACGCGPQLSYCVPASQTPAGRTIRAAIEDEPLRIFDDVVTSRRDYFEALSTDDTFVNGLLAAYLRASGGGVVGHVAMDLEGIPADAGWTRVRRGTAHSGVLTTMAFLTRFTSHRGRVQRFRQAFRCEEFTSASLPPAEPEPPVDLTQREGCSGCHAVLEPMTQHWGRFRVNLDYGLIDEGSGDYATLARVETNPLARACRACGRAERGCPGFCDLYYFTARNTPERDRALVGRLQVTAFDWGNEGLEDDRARFDSGPAALVTAGLTPRDDGRPSVLESCTIRTRAESLLHRPLTDDELRRWVPTLATAFTASGRRDFLALERAIVRDRRYRGD